MAYSDRGLALKDIKQPLLSKRLVNSPVPVVAVGTPYWFAVAGSDAVSNDPFIRFKFTHIVYAGKFEDGFAIFVNTYVNQGFFSQFIVSIVEFNSFSSGMRRRQSLR